MRGRRSQRRSGTPCPNLKECRDPGRRRAQKTDAGKFRLSRKEVLYVDRGIKLPKPGDIIECAARPAARAGTRRADAVSSAPKRAAYPPSQAEAAGRPRGRAARPAGARR